ncbi:MAG: RNA polymerase sigma factor [Myxococcota bacterium]
MHEDAELLVRWRDGDSAAGEALFVRRVGEITRFFRNKVADDAEVPDLVSQTFLGLTTAKDGFRGDASVRRFLFQIATKVLHTHLRKRYKRAREQADFGALCIAALTPRSPSSLMMRERGRQAFVDGLRSLSLDDQIILELRYFEALRGPEIADALELPEGTVRGRIARATRRLAETVQRSLEDAPGSRPAIDDAMLAAWAADVRVAMGRDAPGQRDG